MCTVLELFGKAKTSYAESACGRLPQLLTTRNMPPVTKEGSLCAHQRFVCALSKSSSSSLSYTESQPKAERVSIYTFRPFLLLFYTVVKIYRFVRYSSLVSGVYKWYCACVQSLFCVFIRPNGRLLYLSCWPRFWRTLFFVCLKIKTPRDRRKQV